jgi:hypothetical protein
VPVHLENSRIHALTPEGASFQDDVVFPFFTFSLLPTRFFGALILISFKLV